MNRSLSFTAAALCGIAVFSTLPLAGCGGGNSSYVQSTAGQNSFAGRAYASTVTLGGGQIGALRITTSANGTASGTFTLDDGASRQTAGQTRVVIATSLLSGTFDPVSGAINLSGSYAFGGRDIPLSISGTLPFPPSVTGGNLTVVVEGESYTSSFDATIPTLPTPAPGTTPTPGATPTPSASPSPGSGAFTFALVSKSADCNFSDSGFANLQVDSSTYSGGASSGLYLFSGVLKSGNTSFQVSWQRLNAPNGIVPETFTFVANPAIGPFGDEFQGVIGTAAIIQIGQLSFGAWSPTGGKLIVESVSGSTVRIRGENVEFSPNRFNAISAKGTFTANFTATFDNVSGL